MPPRGRRRDDFPEEEPDIYLEEDPSPPPRPKAKKGGAGPSKGRTMEVREDLFDEPPPLNNKKGKKRMGAEEAEDEGPTSNRPKMSKFSQQQLWACRPILTPIYVVAIFLFIACLFIPLGAACLAASKSVVEVTFRYDDYCMRNYLGSPDFTTAQAEAALNAGANRTGPFDEALKCQIDLRIPKKMKQPVFVYYQLTNYYQNHRRYVKSRSDAELRGDKTTAKALAFCEPQLYSRDFSFRNETSRIKPCGLVAWSYFNDTFSLGYINRTTTGQETAFAINEKDISWKSDREKKYGPVPSQNFNTDPKLRGGATLTVPVNQDEHFMVWMRTAALPKFRKLYGKIETDLNVGDILRLNIENRYNTYRFKGTKSLVLSTNTWLGGKNDFLGIAFLTAGITSFVFAGLFFALDRLHPRKAGDLTHLSWNKNKAQ